jgi:hypothetical protein
MIPLSTGQVCGSSTQGISAQDLLRRSSQDKLAWVSRFSKVVLWGADVWAVASPSCLRGKPGSRNWAFLVEHFSLERLLVSYHYQFLQGGQMCYFLQTVAGSPHSHTGWSTQNSASAPNQAQQEYSLWFLGHQLCPGGLQSAHKLHCTMWFPSEQMGQHTT